MPRLVWLRDHMQHSDILANWLHQQFAYEFADQPLADWQREFAEGQGNGDWQCMIALENGQLLGGAALATNDLPERPELGPWLACVYITPQARKRGLAEQLIEGLAPPQRQTAPRGCTYIPMIAAITTPNADGKCRSLFRPGARRSD